MCEFNKYFDDEFFIIDSNNLPTINTKLYGFLFDNGKIITNENIQDLNRISGEGAYILINHQCNLISIFQDFNGSYGLYVYSRGHYFAISNSFLKLVEYLKDKCYLTLNKDYAISLMSTDLCSIIYKDTLINEIQLIPRNRVIHIDLEKNKLLFDKIDLRRNTVNLDSKNGLEILDKWFYKWVRIIRQLKRNTNNIQFDLSGGFDSRLIFLLLLSSNVDLNKIEIRSFDDGEHCHSADFKIATDIANKFNFKLNNHVISTEKINFKDLNTSLNISFYIKLGFHNQFNYKFFKTKEPVFTFSGMGGGNNTFWRRLLFFNS